jgi:trans-aconitate methyltransferase
MKPPSSTGGKPRVDLHAYLEPERLGYYLLPTSCYLLNMSTPRQQWDPDLYDNKHAFVWQHGASLVELLAVKPGERVLDLGCGTGHLTAAIADAGAEVIGLDHSEQMLAQARSAYPQRTFLLGDARDFHFAEPFDAVFSNAALHWVRPPEKVVRCVAGALKPGGRFVAELGGRGNVEAIVLAMRAAAGKMGLAVQEMPWYFPGVAEYATLLESAGLEVRFATLFDRPTPLTGPDGLQGWVRMFAAALLGAIEAQRRDEFLGRVEEEARPELFRDGVWFADYRRLRVVAVRVERALKD